MSVFFFKSSILYKYRYLVLLSFLVTLIAAYFSVGSHHPDEHFQILEFAHARLGMSDSEALPWEFKQQARPTLQPFLAICVIKILHVIGLYNPFIVAFIIRLITGVCTWLISLVLINFFIGKLKTNRGQLFLVLSMLFLWFVPYLNVRFSSEILSGSSFLLGVLLLLKYVEKEHKKKLFIIIAGLLIGFSFYFRFQIAGAIIGLFVWLVFYKKLQFKDFLILFSGGLLAVLISACIDIWFYDKVIFTPWNYFYFQLVLGKAASFGVSPWWYYFKLFFENAVPPISILLFVFFIIGGQKHKNHAFIWVIIPFVLLHIAIGHKEMRFLYPVFPLFLLIAAFGFDYLMSKQKVSKWLLVVVKFSFALNILLLVYRTLAPAQEAISYYQFLYNASANQKLVVVSIKDDPYSYVGLPINFYKAPNVETQHFASYPMAEEYINNHSNKPVLILHRELVLSYEFSNYTTKRIYTILPAWISKFNVNDWQSRANLYSIYRLEKKPVNSLN